MTGTLSVSERRIGMILLALMGLSMAAAARHGVMSAHGFMARGPGTGLLGLCAFFWAFRNGQSDDPHGAAWRVIPPSHLSRTEGNSHGKLAPDAQDGNARRGL